jgi:cytidylate kinase
MCEKFFLRLFNISLSEEGIMNTPISQNVRLSAAAEKQMRSWAQVHEMASRAIKEMSAERLPPRVIKYVTISRESGTDGTLVARLVAKTLGWSDFGRNLRDHVAHWYDESRVKLDSLDETRGNWVFDTFGSWLDRGLITHDKFVAQVSKMIHILARRGPAVFVGRGAQFLLPRAHTIAVRLVAPESYRLERVQQRQGFATRGEARRWLHSTDAGRRDFVHRYFHHDITDPHFVDLVINVERTGTVGAAGQIVFAVCRAQGMTAPLEVQAIEPAKEPEVVTTGR